MNRQQRRQAQRLLNKGRFPFPELQEWLRSYVARHPETYCQIQEEGVRTNLFSTETQEMGVEQFKTSLEALLESDQVGSAEHDDTIL